MIKFSFQVSFSWGNRWFPRRKPSVSCKENNKKIAECAELAMEELSRRRAKSTIDNYQTALRSLLAYTRKDICVEDIDTALMEGYQRWLQMRGVSRNTSSCYMRSLRALIHHINPETDYKETFKNVFTGNEKTEKRKSIGNGKGFLFDWLLCTRHAFRGPGIFEAVTGEGWVYRLSEA